jgi:tetratricopeptide (TPR) repeat protein
MKRLLQSGLLLAALMMTSVAQARGDDFYEMRLSAGKSSYAEKRYAEAIESLQIACFGLLDHPPRLAEGLVYLALAQTATGRTKEADETLGRFLEVERRFAPFAGLKLDAAVQSEYRALLVRRVAAATLATLPGLAGLVETEEQRIAKLPPRDRTKAYEAAARREPGDPRWPTALARDASAAGDQKAAIDWANRTLGLDPKNVEARALRAHALAARGQCGPARADLDVLPPQEFESWPTLAGDRFVCSVQQQDWARATEFAKRLPPSVASRPDVAKARETLSAQIPN